MGQLGHTLTWLRLLCDKSRVSARSLHAEYVAKLPEWERVRDVLAGEDAVKARGTKYLPKLDSQSDAEFDTYRLRASFFNATARTCMGLVGQIYRKDPMVQLPGSGVLASLGVDCNLSGHSFLSYCRGITEEVIALGRAGTLVDWDDLEGRVFFAMYRAERILNWRVDRRGGRSVLSLVVLSEDYEEVAPDGFEVTVHEQLRVLRLSPSDDGLSSVLDVQIWRETVSDDGTTKVWSLYSSRRPLRHGCPLASIPFVFHAPTSDSLGCAKLPLADVLALNLDHYRLDADYKHGCHYTALPTAWASGFDRETVYRIGSGTAWQTEVPGATAGFLEFTGRGLTTFENAMTRDEMLMSVLGARVLEGQKMVGESAQAIALRHSAQDSILAVLARALSESLTSALRWAAWWVSPVVSLALVPVDEARIEFNTDFATGALSAREIFAVVAAWQAGAISHDGLIEILRRGEIVPAERLDEAELAAAEAARRVKLQVPGGSDVLREVDVPLE